MTYFPFACHRSYVIWSTSYKKKVFFYCVKSSGYNSNKFPRASGNVIEDSFRPTDRHYLVTLVCYYHLLAREYVKLYSIVMRSQPARDPDPWFYSCLPIFYGCSPFHSIVRGLRIWKHSTHHCVYVRVRASDFRNVLHNRPLRTIPIHTIDFV